MPDDQEIIHLPSAGSIPGIPGSHGPGAYVVNWGERTIKRLEDHLAEEEAKKQEEEANQLKEALATGVPLEGISLPADGVMREVVLEGVPEPPAEPSPNDTVVMPAPEPSEVEAPASEEAQPAAPEEASEPQQ